MSWRERIAWPTKNAISTDGIISAAVTAANTIALPQSTGSRFGTAVSEARIIPVEYSAVITSTPEDADRELGELHAHEADSERVEVRLLPRRHRG